MMANAELLTAPSKEMKLSSCGSPIASPPKKYSEKIMTKSVAG